MKLRRGNTGRSQRKEYIDYGSEEETRMEEM